MSIGLLLALPLAVQAAPSPAPWVEATAAFRIVRIDSGTVRAGGLIRDGDDDRLAGAVGPATRRIVVNSAGGQVSTALAMATMIEARGLTVVVDGVCASSCANYLFAAGRRRVVRAGSLLLWHGAPDEASRPEMRALLEAAMTDAGASRADIDETLRREDTRLSGWIAAQDALYRRRGLNPAVLYGVKGALAADARAIHPPGDATGATDMMHLPAQALRCAGFAVSIEGGTPPAVAAARLGIAGIRVVALPLLERALCAPKVR